MVTYADHLKDVPIEKVGVSVGGLLAHVCAYPFPCISSTDSPRENTNTDSLICSA